MELDMAREKERILPEKARVEEHSTNQKVEEKKDNIDDKPETKKILIFLGVIAIICIALFVWIDTSKSKAPKYETYTYNGFTFTKIEGLWHTEWQQGNNLYSVHLRYGPRECKDIKIYSLSNNSFRINKTVYITFDPGEVLGYIALASTELSLNLYNTFHISPIASCTENTTQACYKRPIVTCANTNASVIYIRKANETGAFINGNCLIIQGQNEDMVQVADKVIWTWYGIIK